MKSGIELIAQERQEQIEKHGRTIEQDIAINANHQLVYCASGLLRTVDEFSPMELIIDMGKLHNWDLDIVRKMDVKPYKERLIIAGALIAAELDRIQLDNQLK